MDFQMHYLVMTPFIHDDQLTIHSGIKSALEMEMEIIAIMIN